MSYPDFDCYPIDELVSIGREQLVTIDLKEEDLVFRSMKYRLLALWLLDELAKIPLTETEKCDNLDTTTEEEDDEEEDEGEEDEVDYRPGDPVVMFMLFSFVVVIVFGLLYSLSGGK